MEDAGPGRADQPRASAPPFLHALCPYRNVCCEAVASGSHVLLHVVQNSLLCVCSMKVRNQRGQEVKLRPRQLECTAYA